MTLETPSIVSPGSGPVSGRNSRRIRRLLLALILVLAAALRLYLLAGQSFWADEGNSVVLAARSVSEIVAAAAGDIHPPAYYLLLKAWASLFGLGEIGARTLSVALGVLVVWAVYRLGVRLRGARMGLVAAALAAVNPFLVYYSQEARMYMLLALCATASALALVGWIGASRTAGRRALLWPALLYLGAAGLGLYTHYAFPIQLAALNLVFFLWLWRRRVGPLWPQLTPWLLLNAAVALLFLPWTPIAWRQLTTWPAPPTPLGPLGALEQAFTLFTCGPTFCPPGTPGYVIGAITAILLLVAALVPWRRLQVAWLARVLPLVWLLTPLVVMVVFQIFSPVFFKFLVIAVPAYLLLLALGIDLAVDGLRLHLTTNGRTTGFVTTAAALVLLVAVALPALPALNRYYHDPAFARDDYRSIAAYLKALAGPDDAILLNAPGQVDVFSQYDHGPATVYPLPADRPLNPQATAAALNRILAEHRRVYAIYWATGQSDPEGLIEGRLAQSAFKAWDSWTGDLRFVAYSAEPPPEPIPFTDPPAFGESIRLDAAGISEAPLQPGDIARTLLNWSTTAPLDRSYKTTLQLLDPANQVVAQVDSEPVGGSRPTTTWKPGEVVADPSGLPIPLGTPPGAYPLILAVYDATTGARLPVITAEGAGDHVRLGAVTVVPPASAPPATILPVRYRTATVRGPFTFLGHDRYKQDYGYAPDTPLAPGDSLHVTTFWQVDAAPDGDYSYDLLLDDQPLGRFPLAGPAYPTSRWLPGLPWRGEATVSLPADLATGGAHVLALRLVDPAGRSLGDPIVLSPRLVY